MTNYRFNEILLGVLGIAWGAWLLLFSTYHTSPVLYAFRAWRVWEWVLILWPSVGGIFLLFFSKVRHKPIHLAMCSFWLFITAAIAQTDITLTAVPVYATIGFLHASSYAATEK